MSDYCITDAISLIFDAAILKDNVPGDNGTLELERHLRCRKEGFGSTNVVQKTGKVVCLIIVRPLREVSLDQRGAVDVYSVAVIECLFVQVTLVHVQRCFYREIV